MSHSGHCPISKNFTYYNAYVFRNRRKNKEEAKTADADGSNSESDSDSNSMPDMEPELHDVDAVKPVAGVLDKPSDENLHYLTLT